MIRKVIFTLCFLLFSIVAWSENKVAFDVESLLELTKEAKSYPPDPDMIKRFVGNWMDEDGNSVNFDSEGNCMMKRATNKNFESWELYQNYQGRHYISYYRQNGCVVIMRRFNLSFADDDQTLILNSGEEVLHLKPDINRKK